MGRVIAKVLPGFKQALGRAARPILSSLAFHELPRFVFHSVLQCL